MGDRGTDHQRREQSSHSAMDYDHSDKNSGDDRSGDCSPEGPEEAAVAAALSFPSESDSQSQLHRQPSYKAEAAAAAGGVKAVHKTVSWSKDLTRELPPPATTLPPEANPYVVSPPPRSPSSKSTAGTARGFFRRLGKKVGEAVKKAEDLTGNVLHHLKTGSSVASSKVLAEGGFENVFKQTFETFPEEEFMEAYICNLSTSAGPVVGFLYLSSAKLAFCSDSPLSYKVSHRKERSYYKLAIPLCQLGSINPAASKVEPYEKYIQVVSIDDYEFWFMGFVNYDCALKKLQDTLYAEVNHPQNAASPENLNSESH